MQTSEVINKLNDIRLKLENSPLLHMSNISDLKSIQNDLDVLLSHINQPLKMAILGEVKSGKSTLLNAFAGGQISPTNVTETTACIMKIAFSETSKALFFYKNGKKIEGSIDEIYKLLNDNQNNIDFFSQCDHVEIFKPLSGLKQIEIIDTPGLATITSENEEITRKYFQNIDVVLWVFNVHYLGQSDVNEELRTVANMGKPIIGIVNKIDEIDEEPEEILEYIDKTVGLYLKKCFAISAYQAYTGIQNSDMNLQKKSGFIDLKTYLLEKIERHSNDVLLDSINSSAIALDKKLKYIHEEVLEQIKLKLKSFNTINDEINRRGVRLKEHHLNNTETWVWHTYLQSELDNFIQRIDSGSYFKNVNLEELRNDLVNELNQVSKMEIRQYLQALTSKIEREWKESLSDIDNSLFAIFNKAHNDSILRRMNIVSNSSNNSLTDSIITAGAIGGSLAVYSAVLGPAAAYVSIGTAMGVFMPPILAAGVLVGGLQSIIKNKKEKNKGKEFVQNIISNARQNLSDKLLPDLEVLLDDLCRKTKEKALEEYILKNFNGYTQVEIKNLYANLEIYLKNYNSQNLKFLE